VFDTIHNRLIWLATWPVVALLVVGFIACQLGFDLRKSVLGRAPDGRFWYTPDEVRNQFEDWGAGHRALYAWTEVTLDLFFPLIYGTLFAALLARLFREGRLRGAVMVPIAAAAADLLENATLAFLAWSYDGRPSPLAWAAACFTAVKSVCFGASWLLLLAGGLAGLRRGAA
jgi:hypothetical protein